MNNFGKESTQKTLVENTTQASPKNEGVTIIRPSFMKFCEDGCRAAAFNHILYWIAKKAKGQPQEKIQSGEITYYATTEELVEHMAGAWRYQKVRKEVNELIDMGLLGKARNPKFGADRTKHFFFGKEQCQKLFEFCQKYEINLFGIGLPAEVIELIKAVRQMTNISNANDKYVKCSEHEQLTNMSNANDKYVRAITKVTTKVTNERKNDAPEQKANVPTQQESHSINQSSFSSSQETKPEVVFSPEAEQIYQCAEKLNLVALKKDENHRDYCNTLVEKGVTTIEKLETLLRYCEHLPFFVDKKDKRINLKNLINALPGWLQVQSQSSPPPRKGLSGYRDLTKYAAGGR